jgi:hypothetical protein
VGSVSIEFEDEGLVGSKSILVVVSFELSKLFKVDNDDVGVSSSCDELNEEGEGVWEGVDGPVDPPENLEENIFRKWLRMLEEQRG